MGKDAENLKRARRSSSSTAKAESSRPRNKEDKHLVEKRKAFAKEILRQAWDKGRVCDTSKEVRKLLKDEACEKGLSDGFFDVLSNNDLNDICVSVARESYKSNKILEKRQQSSSPIHEMTPLGQKLPPSPEPSDPGDPEDHDGYNEQRRSSLGTSDRDTESSHGIHIDEISFPSTQFEVHLFHPTKAHFFIVVAKYIGHQESSWISDKIVRQHKLIPKGSTAQTIRLNWGQMTTEGPKKNSTCFWIVDGRKLKHDILIGTKWDDPNDPESDSSGEDSDEDCADSDDDRGSNENSRNRSGDDESGESSDGEGQISEEDEASGAEDSDGFVNISTMAPYQREQNVPATSNPLATELIGNALAHMMQKLNQMPTAELTSHHATFQSPRRKTPPRDEGSRKTTSRSKQSTKAPVTASRKSGTRKAKSGDG